MADQPTATAAPWECARCGERFADRTAAQRHADTCDRPAMRATAALTDDPTATVSVPRDLLLAVLTAAEEDSIVAEANAIDPAPYAADRDKIKELRRYAD